MSTDMEVQFEDNMSHTKNISLPGSGVAHKGSILEFRGRQLVPAAGIMPDDRIAKTAQIRLWKIQWIVTEEKNYSYSAPTSSQSNVAGYLELGQQWFLKIKSAMTTHIIFWKIQWTATEKNDPYWAPMSDQRFAAGQLQLEQQSIAAGPLQLEQQWTAAGPLQLEQQWFLKTKLQSPFTYVMLQRFNNTATENINPYCDLQKHLLVAAGLEAQQQWLLGIKQRYPNLGDLWLSESWTRL